MLVSRRSKGKLFLATRYRTVVLLCTLFIVINLFWYMAIFGFGVSRSFNSILKASQWEEEKSENVSSEFGLVARVVLKGGGERRGGDKTHKKGPMSIYARSIRQTDNRLKKLAEQYDNSQPYFIHPEANRTAYPGPPDGTKMNSVLEMAEAVLSPPNLDVDQPCGGDQGASQGLKVVVFLFCSVGDYSRRQTIRETYGSALKNHSETEIYFVIGRVEDDGLEAQLRKENLKNNDILQFGFNDTYYNLTLKALATLRWAALHCSRAKFAFKLDFDCYIRLLPFLRVLASLPPPTDSTIFGRPPMNQSVIHSQPSKWYIHPLYFPYNTYLLYNGGPYLLPVSKLAAMYRSVVASPNTGKMMSLPSLPFDDAYVTGVLAEKANVSRSTLPGLQMLDPGMNRNPTELDSVVVAYELEDADLRWWWDVYGEN